MTRGPKEKPIEPNIGQLIQKAAANGLRDEDIAEMVEVSEATLKRRFAKELREGRSKNRLDVADWIMTMGKSKKFPQVNIFLAKTRLRWKENHDEVRPQEALQVIFSRGPDRHSVARKNPDQTDTISEDKDNGT